MGLAYKKALYQMSLSLPLQVYRHTDRQTQLKFYYAGSGVTFHYASEPGRTLGACCTKGNDPWINFWLRWSALDVNATLFSSWNDPFKPKWLPTLQITILRCR